MLQVQPNMLHVQPNKLVNQPQRCSHAYITYTGFGYTPGQPQDQAGYRFELLQMHIWDLRHLISYAKHHVLATHAWQDIRFWG